MKASFQKILFALLILGISVSGLSAQAANTASNPDEVVFKQALIIGNGAYTGLSRLSNPVNDAEDMADALGVLGFTVDKVLNGNLEQMESAVLHFRERLSENKNTYGFFFYAGHGVQSGGENFLIPVDANIPSENFLRNRALSVQSMLDEINDAGNSLNVVVLDACRDNPFGWSRSGTRGLSIVNRQPADSIIVYATSAGARASDGDGRNGLFTSQLLLNLMTPGLDVSEVFRLTGLYVAELSNREQIPAIYNQFFGIAYLGDAPSSSGRVTARPVPITPPVQAGREPNGKGREPKDRSGDSMLWSVGASLGTSLAAPWLVGTLRGTVAPFQYSFIDLGLDIGFVSGTQGVGFYSFFPFVHAVYYYPLGKWGGPYGGAGGGFLLARYDFPEGKVPVNSFAMDVIAGFNFMDMLDISYTFRTDFSRASSRLSLGYIYRFRPQRAGN